MMDYSLMHNAAPSAYTWVRYFPNPTYIKKAQFIIPPLPAPHPLYFFLPGYDEVWRNRKGLGYQEIEKVQEQPEMWDYSGL